MDKFLTCPTMIQFLDILENMYRLGYDERNGGNVSVLLEPEDVEEYLDGGHPVREIPLPLEVDPILKGKVVLVTGTGKYFRNTKKDPSHNCGVIRIKDDLKTSEVLWGFEGNSKFTSEIFAHLMCHATRLHVNPNNRVVMHCHPNSLITLSSLVADEKEYTKILWGMETECIVVFPEGVACLPWMLCGTLSIGEATAKCMEDRRLVVWGLHGIYGAGNDIDEAFGLIETAEKAAAMYLVAKAAGGPKIMITDPQLQEVCDLFQVKAREGYLDC